MSIHSPKGGPWGRCRTVSTSRTSSSCCSISSGSPEELAAVDKYREFDRETYAATLEEAARIAAEVLAPNQRPGGSAGLPAGRPGQRSDPRGLRRGVGNPRRGGLDRPDRGSGPRRGRPADGGVDGGGGDVHRRVHGVRDVPGPDRCRGPGDRGSRGAEGPGRGDADVRRAVGGHHVPDRGGRGIGRRGEPLSGGPGGRRNGDLPPRGGEDLHQRWRSGSDGEHRPPRPGPHPRLTGGHQGPVAVRGAQVPPRGAGAAAGGTQRRGGHQDRGEDGDPWLGHLRADPGAGSAVPRLARGTRAPGHRDHVRDDERGADRSRRSGGRGGGHGDPLRHGLRR